MTVKELYEKLKEEIDKGHGDIPVMIHDSHSDPEGEGWDEEVEIQSCYYNKKEWYWPEHLEIGRY